MKPLEETDKRGLFRVVRGRYTIWETPEGPKVIDLARRPSGRREP